VVKRLGKFGVLPWAVHGPKFKSPLAESCVPRYIEYTCQVLSTLTQQSQRCRVLKMLTVHGWTFDWCYKLSWQRWLIVLKWHSVEDLWVTFDDGGQNGGIATPGGIIPGIIPGCLIIGIIGIIPTLTQHLHVTRYTFQYIALSMYSQVTHLKHLNIATFDFIIITCDYLLLSIIMTVHQSQTLPADVIYSQPLDITWPYHDTGSALSVVGPFLSMVRQPGTRYRTVSVTQHSAATASENRWRQIYFVITTQHTQRSRDASRLCAI